MLATLLTVMEVNKLLTDCIFELFVVSALFTNEIRLQHHLGELTTRADWFGLRVGCCLELFYILQMNTE